MSFKTAATFGLGKELVDQKQMHDELSSSMEIYFRISEHLTELCYMEFKIARHKNLIISWFT
jgi:hypothetical protein